MQLIFNALGGDLWSDPADSHSWIGGRSDHAHKRAGKAAGAVRLLGKAGGDRQISSRDI